MPADLRATRRSSMPVCRRAATRRCSFMDGPAGEAPWPSVDRARASIHQPHLVPASARKRFARLSPSWGPCFASHPTSFTPTPQSGRLGPPRSALYNATTTSALLFRLHTRQCARRVFPSPSTARFSRRANARITDRIVTVSPSQQRDIVSACHRRQRKRPSCPGLDLEICSTARASPAYLQSHARRRSDDIVVGSIGRMVAIRFADADARSLATAQSEAATCHRGDGHASRHRVIIGQLRSARVHHLDGSMIFRVYATIDICAVVAQRERPLPSSRRRQRESPRRLLRWAAC